MVVESLEKMRAEVEAYKVKRDAFIARHLPKLQAELVAEIKIAWDNSKPEVLIWRHCPADEYPLYRDVFFALRDPLIEEGFQAKLTIDSDHQFHPEGSTPPTQFWFDLTVYLGDQ